MTNTFMLVSSDTQETLRNQLTGRRQHEERQVNEDQVGRTRASSQSQRREVKDRKEGRKEHSNTSVPSF